MRHFWTAALIVALSVASVAADPPKAVKDAIVSLEAALATSKDQAERDQLQEAIAALKRIGKTAKIQNDLISDFLDNPMKYKGKTLTLQVEYASKLDKLRDRVGDKSVPFIAYDPNNRAKLILGLELPKGLEVPNARAEEPLVVVFDCTAGQTGKGNITKSVQRAPRP